MSDNLLASKPHRVIWQDKSLTRTKILSNLDEAKKFAESKQNVIRIMLATENPNIESKHDRSKIFKFANRDLCKCGKTKLRADEFCFACKGITNVRND